MNLRRGGFSGALSRCTSVLVVAGMLAVNAGCSGASGRTPDELSALENPPGFGGQSGDEGVMLPIPPTPPAVPGTPPAVTPDPGPPPEEPPSAAPHPEALATGALPTTEVNVYDFAFNGVPIAEYLRPFGGERPALWLPEVDAAYPSTLVPSPGPTDVVLTVDGEPTSMLQINRYDGAVSYLFTIPMRLWTHDGKVDVRFVGDIGLLETGEVWTWHDFTAEELGGAIQLRVPEGSSSKVRYSLSATLWPGGSAGSLSAGLVPAVEIVAARPTGTYTTQDDPSPPTQLISPSQAPSPAPSPVEPPAGWPDAWQTQQTPGTLLTWPNGKHCNNASGIDYALDGLSPRAVIDAVSHLDALMLERADVAPDGESKFTISVSVPQEDVCVSTDHWDGSTLARLSVTVDMHVTDEQSGLVLTIPVDVAALHEGAQIDTVYFASSIEAWTWAPTGRAPTIDGSNLQTFTGLSGAPDAYAVFPLLTGMVRFNGESFEANGQMLVAVPTRDVDGNSDSVTSLNLGGAEPTEVEMLFSGGEWTGVDAVLFDGVWSSGGSEP